jgi:glycosyltransferase involved in cell wall biosynthesis
MQHTLSPLAVLPAPVLAQPLRLAIVCDYLEEGWVSMNFCAEMLMRYLQAEHRSQVQPTQILPAFRQRLQQVPSISKTKAFQIDRMLNCFWDYPRHLSQQVPQFDYFHICDHSYAHLVHALPPEHTGVFCHDIDAFRPLLEPERYPASRRMRLMLKRVLQGMQKAAVVFHTTAEVRRQIEHYRLIDPARLVQVPLGIAPEFAATASQSDAIVRQQVGHQPFLLSVSSNKRRKRLDVLLDVFAALRRQHPTLRLVRVGRDGWTAEQQSQINRLGITDGILYLQGLDRATLAALYRHAAIVLVTSEAEGFGLPVIEALACGAVIVASDIPTLREVGGSAAAYAPVGDVSIWTETIARLLSDATAAPDRPLRLTQAAQYSWSAHAETIAQTYVKLAGC